MRKFGRITQKLLDNIIGDSRDDYSPSKFRTLKSSNKKIKSVYLDFESGKKVKHWF